MLDMNAGVLDSKGPAIAQAIREYLATTPESDLRVRCLALLVPLPSRECIACLQTIAYQNYLELVSDPEIVAMNENCSLETTAAGFGPLTCFQVSFVLRVWPCCGNWLVGVCS